MRRPSKFGAVPTFVDGIRFDSKGEARRWGELKLMERAGQIRDLERQVPYRLEVNGELVSKYVADFRYFDRAKSVTVVEDFKGHKTPEYRIKAKLMKALHRVEILETGA